MPQGMAEPVREQDCGKSERQAVMVWIGDAMIAPARKGADVHAVAYCEIGLSFPNRWGKSSDSSHVLPMKFFIK